MTIQTEILIGGNDVGPDTGSGHALRWRVFHNKDGSVLVEMRPEDEVFSQGSMESLRTAPITDGHPKVMVNPDNIKELGMGHTNGVVSKEKVDGSDEPHLGTHLIVTHRDAIQAIEAGKAEISLGYKVDLEFSAGEHKGEKFDAVQRNIVNNHIALVWKGRAGTASLVLDEEDAILITDSNKGNETMKITIGKKEFDVADELGNAVNAEIKVLGEKSTEIQGKLDDAVKSVETKDAEIATAKDESTKQTAKIDSLEADLEKAKKATPKTDGVDVNAAVKERISIMGIGQKMLDTETIKKIDSMSNEEIKVAVIKVDSPKIDEEKLKNDSYVDARFDHITENLDGVAKVKKKLGKEIVDGREDGDQDPEYKTPEQMRKDSQEADNKASREPIGRQAK